MTRSLILKDVLARRTRSGRGGGPARGRAQGPGEGEIIMAQFVGPPQTPESGMRGPRFRRGSGRQHPAAQRLDDFIGQEELSANLPGIPRTPRASAGRPWTMCCSTATPVWARPPWPESWPPNWASIWSASSGPVLERSGDLAAILTNLARHDILFVDEIHRMPISRGGSALSGHGGFQAGSGHRAGAGGPHGEDRPGTLSPWWGPPPAHGADFLASAGPFRHCRPGWSTTRPTDLARVVRRTARILGVEVTPDGAEEIGRRSRGTPRIANRLLRRVRDFALILRQRAGRRAGRRSAALKRMDVDRARSGPDGPQAPGSC